MSLPGCRCAASLVSVDDNTSYCPQCGLEYRRAKASFMVCPACQKREVAIGRGRCEACIQQPETD